VDRHRTVHRRRTAYGLIGYLARSSAAGGGLRVGPGVTVGWLFAFGGMLGAVMGVDTSGSDKGFQGFVGRLGTFGHWQAERYGVLHEGVTSHA